MFSINSNQSVNMCSGCLTEGQAFGPLPEVYVTIYYNLINEKLLQKVENQLNICLCTECFEMVKKISEFQDKICTSYVQLHGCFIMQLKNVNNLNYDKGLYQNTDDKFNEDNINGDITTYNDNNDKLIKKNIFFRKHTTKEIKKKNDKNKVLKVVKNNYIIKKKNQNHLQIKNPISDISMCYSKIKIDIANELEEVIENDQNYAINLKNIFLCEFCLKGYNKIEHLEKHNNNYHTKLDNKDFICNMCQCFFSTKHDLEKHLKSHNFIHKCNLCSFTCVKRWMVKDHIKNSHCKLYYCKLCRHGYSNCKDFNDHYKALHTHLDCDYCGKRFLKKNSIRSHIRRNHIPPECTTCGLSYRTYHSLYNHNRRVHPRPATDTAYCVECDKQFSSDYNYRNHLRTGVRHVAPHRLRVSCPECDKVFSRRTYMNNHYRLAHAHTSEHYCGLCNKYFVTAFSLRQHTKLVHDKIALPKNKVCKLCGKAFSTNRTLSYHIRTHTGIRPYLCDYCPSRFSQKKSVSSHLKAVHSVVAEESNERCSLSGGRSGQ